MWGGANVAPLARSFQRSPSARRNPVDLEAIRRWSRAERALQKYEEFRRQLERPAREHEDAGR